MDHTHDKDDPTMSSMDVVQTFSSSSISLATRLLTFTLSSYVGIIVANYWTNGKWMKRNYKIQYDEKERKILFIILTSARIFNK